MPSFFAVCAPIFQEIGIVQVTRTDGHVPLGRGLAGGVPGCHRTGQVLLDQPVEVRARLLIIVPQLHRLQQVDLRVRVHRIPLAKAATPVLRCDVGKGKGAVPFPPPRQRKGLMAGLHHGCGRGRASAVIVGHVEAAAPPDLAESAGHRLTGPGRLQRTKKAPRFLIETVQFQSDFHLRHILFSTRIYPGTARRSP